MLMDAFRMKMKSNVESKIKAAKDAWETLDKERESEGATNSQADLDYTHSVGTAHNETTPNKLTTQ